MEELSDGSNNNRNQKATPPLYFGRVMLTQREPAGPFEFWAWLQDTPDLAIEVGSLLVAEGENNERILALVEDMEYSTSTGDRLAAFYSSGYGNPNVKPRTKPAIVRAVKLRVLYRDPSRATPPEGGWGIRAATAKDVEILAQRIPDKWRILAGFLRVGMDEGDPKSWLPLYVHSQYLFGPEGAHANITGATGLATKSSYALFLALSALAWAKQAGENTAVVLFNVKQMDFLGLHKMPKDWEQANEWIATWADNIGEVGLTRQTRAMWKSVIDSGGDLLELKPVTKYFTYQGDPDQDQMEEPIIYSYGFDDLEKGDFMAALFTASDKVTDPQPTFLHAYLEAKLGRGTSFAGMKADLQDVSRKGAEVTVKGVSGSYMSGVVSAVWRRVAGFLSRASRAVEEKRSKGQPLKFSALKPNSLNVVQLYRLSEAEKRLVFNAVVREISRGLEKPDPLVRRVIVIVDELNKFAPTGGFSPIKEQIIDVVARGRSLQFTLIGAEQFASEIDSQVYGNAGTKVVGYSDESEVSDRIYRYLGDLRDQVPNLKKGQMILRHSPYPAPIIFWFPAPLHTIARAAGVGDTGVRGVEEEWSESPAEEIEIPF
jgi:hypothetical protein